MQQISWLIGYTESRKEIRVYQGREEEVLKRLTNSFSEIDHFQSFATLEAYNLFVAKRYPDDYLYSDQVKECLKFHYNRLGGERIEQLKIKYSIRTSMDLCKLGRKFLM